MSGWYCTGCGCDRSVEDFGQPCHCGEYAMACDEQHAFTRDQLRLLAQEWKEARPSDGVS